MDLFRLDGKAAIVTGASRGIGRGLAEAGANVAVLGHRGMPEGTQREVEATGAHALSFQGDLSDREFRNRAVEDVKSKWGSVDILVNNAGTTVRTPAVDFAEEDWDRVIDVNLTSVFRMCQRVGREMLKQGGGKIINIASVQSFTGGITIPAYAASKGGIAQITKALANEWAALNVNVNAIAPGYILTDLTRPLYHDPVRSKEIMDRIPIKRWGTPDVGVEKVGAAFLSFGGLNPVAESVGNALTGTYAVAVTCGVVGWLRNRTSRLMFWAVAARKNCSRTNFNLRRCRRRRPM